MVYQGFDPYVNEDSILLILGSFPSVKSREEGFYYGNRQNRFWRILAEAFSAPVPESISDKKELLRTNRIALWDVVISCEITGSMDKDIINPVIADIPKILGSYPIKSIITNGGKAKELLIKNYPQYADICTALPSTSPANARLDKSVWLNALRKIFL